MQVHWQLSCGWNIEQSKKNNSDTKKYLMTDTSDMNWTYLAITVACYEINQVCLSSVFLGFTPSEKCSAYLAVWRSFRIIWQFDLEIEVTLSLNKQYQSCEAQWKVKKK